MEIGLTLGLQLSLTVKSRTFSKQYEKSRKEPVFCLYLYNTYSIVLYSISIVGTKCPFMVSFFNAQQPYLFDVKELTSTGELGERFKGTGSRDRIQIFCSCRT